jgi:hypothetical protein
LDGAEIGVSGIQQDVPLAVDRRRWNEKGRAFSAANPLVSKSVQRFVSSLVPARRKSFYVKSAKLNRFGDAAFDRDEIRWS